MASHYLFLLLHFQPASCRQSQPSYIPHGKLFQRCYRWPPLLRLTPTGILSVAAVLIGRRPIAVTDESPMTPSPLLLSENPLSTTSSPATTPANVHSQHLDRRRGSQPLPDAFSWIQEPSRGQLF
ncbi:hypothetical protein HPP92_014243 [Vanilla planifolia]|uniref:Uncharacterized protein n=1 Tax=Vanilla planifolia TaxID=51239 RepID=A0A835QTG6_VANPL|nr:hypothetical protein HPP92_014243 [Vanilla planifolia]